MDYKQKGDDQADDDTDFDVPYDRKGESKSHDGKVDPCTHTEITSAAEKSREGNWLTASNTGHHAEFLPEETTRSNQY